MANQKKEPERDSGRMGSTRTRETLRPSARARSDYMLQDGDNAEAVKAAEAAIARLPEEAKKNERSPDDLR